MNMVFDVLLAMDFKMEKQHKVTDNAKSWMALITKLETESQYDSWKIISIKCLTS